MVTEEIKHPIALSVKSCIARLFTLKESEITIRQRGESTFQLYYESYLLAYYDGECVNIWNFHPAFAFAFAKAIDEKKNEYTSLSLLGFLELSPKK